MSGTDAPNESITLDCSQLTSRELGERLRTLDAESQVVLRGLSKELAGVGSGFDLEIAATLAGDVGDFALMLSQHADWDIQGSVGVCCAHSLVSGSVLVRGSASDYAGAFARGGFLAVLGSAGFRCGFRNAGGDILVRSRVGSEAGAKMLSGDLVLANGAGDNLGHGMVGGTIYLRGDVDSISRGVRGVRMKDADSMRLSLLLARAGIKGDVKEFKLYRAR